MAKEPKKLDALFHDTLKDIYFAEKKILSTLPKMAKAAQSEELKARVANSYWESLPCLLQFRFAKQRSSARS
jgi:ferritin-like metal-binding protein YciE